MKQTFKEWIKDISPDVYGFYRITVDNQYYALFDNTEALITIYGNRLVESETSLGPDQGTGITLSSQDHKETIEKELTISEIVKISHNNAKEKGWWDKPKTLPELICLVHSELSEALEEVRNGKEPNETYYSVKKKYPTSFEGQTREIILYSDKPGVSRYTNNDELVKINKPEGVPSELADVVIRIGDICGYFGIDLEAAIKEKIEYNKSRSYRHGNKVL